MEKVKKGSMPKHRVKKAWPWLWLSGFIILLDQLVKYLVIRHLIIGKPIVIVPFFNLSLNYNTGAAFSFLGEGSGWQVYFLAAISLAVALALTFWLGRVKRSDVFMGLGISLIIGGAIGNFIDRVRLNYVIDYFDFHVKSWHFATFNIADSAICIGAFFIIIKILVPSPNK